MNPYEPPQVECRERPLPWFADWRDEFKHMAVCVIVGGLATVGLLSGIFLLWRAWEMNAPRDWHSYVVSFFGWCMIFTSCRLFGWIKNAPRP